MWRVRGMEGGLHFHRSAKRWRRKWTSRWAIVTRNFAETAFEHGRSVRALSPMFKTLINQCIKLLHFHCFKCAFGFFRKITPTFSGNLGCCVHTHAIPFLFCQNHRKGNRSCLGRFFRAGAVSISNFSIWHYFVKKLHARRILLYTISVQERISRYGRFDCGT